MLPNGGLNKIETIKTEKIIINSSVKAHILKNFSIQEKEFLCSKSFYISGGTGFVGRWIISVLLNLLEGEKLPAITILTRNPQKARNLFTNENLIRTISWQELDSIPNNDFSNKEICGIHSGVPASSGEIISEEDVKFFGIKTFQFITKIAKISDDPTFVNLSTGGVYVRPVNGFISENETRKQNTILTNYEKIKITDEVTLESFVGKEVIKGANPRLFSFCGPGLAIPGNFALSSFIHLAQMGQPIKLTGNPDSLRSYMSPVDMAIWIIKCAIYPTLETLHIGSNEAFTMQQIAEIIANRFGTNVEIEECATDQPIQNYVPVTDFTSDHLNVALTLDFHSAIEYWLESS